MCLTCLWHGDRYPVPLQARILHLRAFASTWIILGACKHRNLFVCSSARDIVLVVPLQAPYSLFKEP